MIPNLTEEQAMPVPNASPSVQGMVRADLETREQLGRERYGTALQPNNGRDALRDLYEELLDAACYARQALEERPREDVDAAVAEVNANWQRESSRQSDLIGELRRQLETTTRVREQWIAEARRIGGDYENLRTQLKAAEERANELTTVLAEVLRNFTFTGHPGRACLQTGWVEVGTVGRWRQALHSEPAAQAAVQEGLDSRG